MTTTPVLEPSIPGGGAGDTPTRLSRWLGGLALFLAVMTPMLAYLAPLGFAPLLALVGLLALPGVKPTRATLPPWLILAVLAVWAAISMAWSPEAVDLSKLKTYDDLEGLTAAKLFLQTATYGAAVVALVGL